VTLQPFTVDVPQATLDDLAERLTRTRWPGELDGPEWEDGTSPAFMRELLEWWRTGFDWRAQEAAINRYPHFRATVDGVGLHFLHRAAAARRRCHCCSPTAGPAASSSCCRWCRC
jgi:epoxide hydrolase